MKIILLITVFFFIYPIYLKFLPIPLDRVLQIFGFLAFFFNLAMHRKEGAQLIRSKSVIKFYAITFVLLLLSFLVLVQRSSSSDLYFVKYVLDAVFNFFSAFLIFTIAKRCYRRVDMGLILYYIVLTAVLQAIVCAFFFMSPSSFAIYSNLLNQDVSQGYFDRLGLINIRFIGIGSQFFSGGVKFGFAFLSLLVLPYISSFKLVKNKFLYSLVLFFIVVGGVLTARTFFVAIILGIFFVIKLKSRNIFEFISANIKIVITILVSVGILLALVDFALSRESKEKVLGFAFEMFQNDASNEGEFHTRSTSRLLEMIQVVPHDLKTWFVGDGKMMTPSGGYYMHTDVGYLRLIFYFGLPATLFFVFTLFRYCRILSKLSFNKYFKDKALRYYFVFIFIFEVICNLKGLTYDNYYFVLFLIVLVLSDKKLPIGVENFK